MGGGGVLGGLSEVGGLEVALDSEYEKSSVFYKKKKKKSNCVVGCKLKMPSIIQRSWFDAGKSVALVLYFHAEANRLRKIPKYILLSSL